MTGSLIYDTFFTLVSLPDSPKGSNRRSKSMITRHVSIQCGGRDKNGNPVLDQPLDVRVILAKRPGSNSIAAGPKFCTHNTGGHGERCRASHPDKDWIGDVILCPYSFDFPQVHSHKPDWEAPTEINAAFEEIQTADAV